jgi:hypothetical protein
MPINRQEEGMNDRQLKEINDRGLDLANETIQAMVADGNNFSVICVAFFMGSAACSRIANLNKHTHIEGCVSAFDYVLGAERKIK